MTSPQFKITRSDLPSLYKSALISFGGIVMALAFFFGFKLVLPAQDFSQTEGMIATAIGAWIVNLVKTFIEEK